MWYYETSAGTFLIVEKAGWFHVMYNDEMLGRYKTPEGAAEELAGGATDWPAGGIDPSGLGIPEDLGDWERGRS